LGRTGLSKKELSRVEVMGRVKGRSLRLIEAAEMLGLSYRQSKRIWARYRAGGARALQHGNCGRVSNRAYGAEFRAAVLKQVQARYEDFGSTLAAEHLASDDGLNVQAETLRRWRKEAGLWQRQRRRKPYRQRREAKAHFGELVQLDGSFHQWLEGRGPRGCLMHMVDDATTQALGWFCAEESIWAAVAVLRRWIERYGVPQALYTDWKNVYVRPPNARERMRGETAVTQFGRMCAKLGIEIIAASSPQAKGRVERAHGTHQDRLVKKLRLAGIANYDQANAYLDQHYLRTQPALRACRGGGSRLSPEKPDGAATGRSLLAGGTTRAQRGLGGALPEPAVATGTTQPAQGTGEEPGAGAGKPSRGTGDSLSRSRSGVPRMEGGFYIAGRGKGRCPFPRAPIPKTEIVHPCGGSSVEKKSLSTNENTDLFYGLVKTTTGHF